MLARTVEEEKIHWVEGNSRVESRPAGDPALMREAIQLLAKARRPIVLTGSGVLWSRAENELRNFIDATGIPFFTTPQVCSEDEARVKGNRLIWAFLSVLQ